MQTITTNIYVGLCLLLPLFRLLQHRNGRAYPFILLTSLQATLSIICGWTVGWDGFAILIALIGMWMVVSLFWGDQPHNAIFSCIQWIATLYFILVCRGSYLPLLCMEVFAVGCVFAALKLYTHWRKGFNVAYFTFFGNSNHDSIFFCLSLLSGVWLTMNTSYLFLPFLILLYLVIVLSRGRAGIIATTLSLPIALGYPLWTLVCLPILLGGGYYLYKKGRWKVTVLDRSLYTLLALHMIWLKPLFGWGLEAFRRQSVHMMTSLRRPWEKTLLELSGGKGRLKTHRVHNDHLELVVELGIIGYVLFVLPFTFIPYSPFYLALVVGVGVNGLLFFPLREIHIVIPFLALVGACATPTTFDPSIIIRLTLLCVVGMVSVIVYQKGVGLLHYGQMMVSPSKEAGMFHALCALASTPYDTTYLTSSTSMITPTNPMEAYLHSSRAINHYDGETILWELYHQYAIVMLNINSIAVAQWALHQALNLNPTYTPSLTLLSGIEQQIAQINQVNKVNSFNNVTIGGF